MNILHNKMASHHPSQISLTTTPNQMSYKDNIGLLLIYFKCFYFLDGLPSHLTATPIHHMPYTIDLIYKKINTVCEKY